MDKYLYNNGTHLRLFLPSDYKSRSYVSGTHVDITYSRKCITVTRGKYYSKECVSITNCIYSGVANFMPRGVYKLVTENHKSITFRHEKDSTGRTSQVQT